MRRINSVLVAASALHVLCSATTLFAADSLGNLTTLELVGEGSNYELSVTSKTPRCEANPSWLTLDYDSRLLYCLDRGGNTSVTGSLNSFSIEKDGTLTHLDRVEAPLSGVAGEIVTASSGTRAYVSAS